MNSNPEGPKKNKKFTKKAKRQNSTSLSIPTTKKSDTSKPKILGKLPTNKKSKKYVAATLKRQTTRATNPPRFSKKNEQGKTKSMAQVFDSRTRNSTRRDTGSSHNYTSSRRDEGASSNSGHHKNSASNSGHHKNSFSNSGHHKNTSSNSGHHKNSSFNSDYHKNSSSNSDYHKNASSNSGHHKNASSNSDYHKNHSQQRPHSYASNSWQSQPGYNGYVDSSWDPYYGYASTGGYNRQWGFDQPNHPLNQMTQNHFKNNKWKSKELPENGSKNMNNQGSFHPATSYGVGSHHRSPSSSLGSFNQSPSSRSKFVPRPKRPLQSIEEIKRQKEEAAKVAKRNKEEAARVAQEMRKEEEIAATKSRLVASLKAQENQGQKVKFTFSPGHWSPSSKEEERDRPQQELRPVPQDLAQIGLGADVAVPLLEDDPPPVLPVYVNCLATAPVTTEGQVQERPRVAYTARSSPSTSSISDGEEGPSNSTVVKAKTSFNNPKVPKSRTAFRSRTVSESNKRVGFAGKRSRKTSEQNSRSLELPETRAEKDVYDIGKFKQALLKMNKRELSELVNTPTSTKSKILMSALVRDHKRLISQRLNQVRFNCTSKMLVSMGENLDNADSLMEVELPPELLVHISDIIKMEVPDVEIVAEKLCSNPEYPASSAIKQELSAGHSLQEKVKEEVEEIADEVIEVPVPPKPTPPLVDLETSEEIRAGDNAVEITQDTVGHKKKNTKFNGTNSKAKDNASKAKDNATKAKDNATKAKDNAILAEEPSDLVPFEGLRREPRKRGRPKNGEVRRNLGQEIVIGTIETIDSSENDSSHDCEDSSTTNKKAKFQEEQKDKTNESVEEKDATNGNVEQPMDSIPADEGSNNNERNLGLIFEQESRLWSKLKANRREIDLLQKEEKDLLNQLDWLNELKKPMFKL